MCPTFYSRIASVVWEERFHIIVSVASKNLKCQRRSLRQRRLYGNQALRWLEIVYWRARPVLLNTATESRPMHATFKLNMLRARAHQARACANNDLVPSKSLENLDFDQKCLWKLTVKIFEVWYSGKERTEISVLIERKNSVRSKQNEHENRLI